MLIESRPVIKPFIGCLFHLKGREVLYVNIYSLCSFIFFYRVIFSFLLLTLGEFHPLFRGHEVATPQHIHSHSGGRDAGPEGASLAPPSTTCPTVELPGLTWVLTASGRRSDKLELCLRRGWGLQEKVEGVEGKRARKRKRVQERVWKNGAWSWGLKASWWLGMGEWWRKQKWGKILWVEFLLIILMFFE